MRIHYIFLLSIGLLMASCHVVKQVAIKKEVPAITENKLLKNLETNELDYSTFFAKRIDVKLSNKKGGNSFRASLKIRRDSFIQVSVMAPLGIEIARILLTMDSIKFVDIYHKKYFISDYNYFVDKYDACINYDCIQKILTNTFFNFEICGGGVGKNKKYKLERLDRGYELSTVEERALSRKIKKLYRKRKKNKDFVLILQKILIDPQSFRPLSMSIEDIEEEVGVSVNYIDFKEFSGKIFPGKIIFDLFSEQSKTSLELKFQKLDFDVSVEPNLRILSKYKRIE